MIFTFGHSTLSAEDGAALLKDSGIRTLIDIRSHPNSKWEAWRIENLREWVPANDLDFEWMPELGGWTEHHMPMAERFAQFGVDLASYSNGKFPKQRIGVHRNDGFSNDTRPSWTNQGLWDYQFYTVLPAFHFGIEKLIKRFDNDDQHCAIMCCEVLWWKCHRSMVADCLYDRGIDVYHLQPKLTYHAAAIGNRIERYDPEVRRAWDIYKTI